MISTVTGELSAALTFGPDQPRRFLTAWYGPPRRGPSEAASIGLPSALTEWHQQADRWDHPVMTQNRVPAQREMHGELRSAV